MRKMIRLIKKENGAELLEAAMIYPIVIACICLLLYWGVYILQYMTLSAYAQKIAILAAREVSRPGYLSMILPADRDKVIGSEGIEFQIENFAAGVTADANKQGSGDSLKGLIHVPSDVKDVNARAYRFWVNPLDKNTASEYEKILKTMVDNHAFMKASGNGAVVDISARNYVVAQYIDVSISQELIDFPMLDFLGIQKPKVTVTATAAATDIDEFVRNTDLVIDTLDALARKLGINVDGIKEKVEKAKDLLGLN